MDVPGIEPATSWLVLRYAEQSAIENDRKMKSARRKLAEKHTVGHKGRGTWRDHIEYGQIKFYR